MLQKNDYLISYNMTVNLYESQTFVLEDSEEIISEPQRTNKWILPSWLILFVVFVGSTIGLYWLIVLAYYYQSTIIYSNVEHVKDIISPQILGFVAILSSCIALGLCAFVSAVFLMNWFMFIKFNKYITMTWLFILTIVLMSYIVVIIITLYNVQLLDLDITYGSEDFFIGIALLMLYTYFPTLLGIEIIALASYCQHVILLEKNLQLIRNNVV